MNNEFANEDALAGVIRARLKAAGEQVWQRYPLPWTHPSFRSCADAAVRLLREFGDFRTVLVMRDACLRPLREHVLASGRTLVVPSRRGDAVIEIPASAAGRALRIDPLPQGSRPFTGSVDVVVVACLAFSASEPRLYTFELERTACVLDELRQGLVNGWSLTPGTPVVAVASDQQEVSGWPSYAQGLVEANAVFTQSRTIILRA